MHIQKKVLKYNLRDKMRLKSCKIKLKLCLGILDKVSAKVTVVYTTELKDDRMENYGAYMFGFRLE